MRPAWWALAVLLGTAACVLLLTRQAPAPETGTEHRASLQAARFGPGVWVESPGSAVEPSAWSADTAAPPGPFAEVDGRLRIDRGLRDLFDYFLLGGHAGDRAHHLAALEAHLLQHLRDPALGQARDLMRRYERYLIEHDNLLARERMPAITADSPAVSMDFDRLQAWLSQRARLRQDLLGMQVATAWFAEEERELQQVLAHLREGKPVPSLDADPLQALNADLRELEQQGAGLSIRREAIASRFGEQAAVRYEKLEREEQAWQAQFSQYREQAQQLRRQGWLPEAEREAQIERLRAQHFPDEAQRLRARALDEG